MYDMGYERDRKRSTLVRECLTVGILRETKKFGMWGQTYIIHLGIFVKCKLKV
jgi:hypothetical protein